MRSKILAWQWHGPFHSSRLKSRKARTLFQFFALWCPSTPSAKEKGFLIEHDRFSCTFRLFIHCSVFNHHHTTSFRPRTMLPRIWTCFFVLFIRSLALAVPMTHDAQLTPILTTSSSPMPTFSSVRTPCHTTRFTHRLPESLTFGVHVRRWLLTRRRKLEFFVHWVVGALLPEIRPTKEDFLYLRSLEDPIFMSATELPRTISTLLPMSPMYATIPTSHLREDLSSDDRERKWVVEDLDQIFQRNRDDDRSILDSQD